jgi:CubicO group peptidase (beta-lactamase class C family)
MSNIFTDTHTCMKKLIPFLFVFLYSIAFAQKKTDSLTAKMDAIFSAYNNKTSAGLAAGIVRNGNVIFKKGYGLANMEYDIPNTPSSVFDIASVSKQFAGLAISTLVQQGKIALTDDIHKYLLEVPDFGKIITINHLVHHTSGLRDWPEGLNVAGWRWDEVFSFEDIQRMVKHQKELDFEPGEKYSYSNTGYNLLALIVERVSGKSFREWTDANIFAPLQMSSSHFLDDHSKLIKNMAYSYYNQPDGYHKRMTGLTALGSSSLFTNVDDLCKWVINFDAQVTAKNPIYLRMLEDGVLNNGEKVGYAFGLALGDLGGVKTVNHTGGWAGYRTVIMNFPDEKLSIILLGNVADFNSYGSATEVAKYLLKGKIKETESKADNSKDLPTTTFNEATAKKQAGIYKFGDGWYVTLTIENGALMTQATGEPKFPTVPKSDSVIWIDGYNSSMTFIKDKEGVVNALRYRDKLRPKIVPIQPDLSKLNTYVGTYYSEELGTEYKIDYVNNNLAMHHMRLGDFDITPDVVEADVFSCEMGSLKFYFENGKVAGFRLSRGRVKNLKFTRR